MAFRMPSPFRHKTGIYFLNVRLPIDLVAKVKGTKLTLPVGSALVSIKATDKVFLSLRTKDKNVARERFLAAYGALNRHFMSLRADPKPLTHRQIVALAGEIYRFMVTDCESDPVFVPHGWHTEHKSFEKEVAGWRDGWNYKEGEIADDGGPFPDNQVPIPEAEARLFAAIARPFGPELLALETNADVDTKYASVTLDAALEKLLGRPADLLLGKYQIYTDAASRKQLLQEIGTAIRLVADKVDRNAGGDYAPDENAKRFPDFDPAALIVRPGPYVSNTMQQIGVRELFARWCTYNANKTAPSTIRRYTASIESLARFTDNRDIRTITQDDIWAWAEQRRDTDKIATATVNGNDLVAASSIFTFATTRNADVDPKDRKIKRKLRVDNPAKGVKLDVEKKQTKRAKTFRAEEVAAILTLARGVHDPRYPKAAASRRWAPWLCAYSGARIQEICWLSKKDIQCDGGTWVMHFTQTKNGFARTVPLHPALIDEGFVDFYRGAPDGFLFVGDRSQKQGATRTQQEQRASEIAAWIREKVKLEAGVSPNHGWRHTFCTNAEGAGISKRMANAIAGHNREDDVSDRYVEPSIKMLTKAINKYPRYKIVPMK